mmetsp:Transcript_62493/g.71690  ORF Transcript_62493/g.71690 Transcript_62493/m.71690 type:complete len:121 (+) Transcript_62493:374-736(+)
MLQFLYLPLIDLGQIVILGVQSMDYDLNVLEHSPELQAIHEETSKIALENQDCLAECSALEDKKQCWDDCFEIIRTKMDEVRNAPKRQQAQEALDKCLAGCRDEGLDDEVECTHQCIRST